MGLKLIVMVVLSFQGWIGQAATEAEPLKTTERAAPEDHVIEFSSHSSKESQEEHHCYQCVYGLDGMMDKNCLHPTPETVKNVSCESSVTCATVSHQGPTGLLLIRTCGIGHTEICGAIGSHTYEDLKLDELFDNTNLSSSLKIMLQNLSKGNETGNGTDGCPKVCYCNRDMCNGKSDGEHEEASPHRDPRTILSDDPLPAVDKNATGHPEVPHDDHHGGAKGGSAILDISRALVCALIMTSGFIFNSLKY